MNHITIIAEVGVNHNGDIKLAKKLIDVASECGADIVKFQSFNSEKLATDNAPKAKYQINKKNVSESQKGLLKKLEISRDDHIALLEYCSNKKIEFLSTPFDLDSFNLLLSLGLKKIKVSSGNITDFELLKEIAKHDLEIFLSTGMATLGEIEDSILLLEKYGTSRKKVCLLHCTSQYPAPKNEVNLNAIKTLCDAFRVKVGYSDHTEGVEVAIASVALGARVLEKHITLDTNMEGPDHSASLNPSEFNKTHETITGLMEDIMTEAHLLAQVEGQPRGEKIQIDSSKFNKIKLREGMILSNEPGYYKKNKFGIRIENLIYVKKNKNKLYFENLTLAPIDKDLINFDLLTNDEKSYLWKYHLDIYTKLHKFLNPSEKKWLATFIQ